MRNRLTITAAVTVTALGILASPANAGPSPDNTIGTAPHTLLNVPDGPTGDGIRIAVVDSGIAVETRPGRFATNPCFDDTGYPTVEHQGDVQYTNNKVPIARAYFIDRGPLYPGGPDPNAFTDAKAFSVHGSHVAGIIGCDTGTLATVGGETFTISGIAPHVTLGNYNVFPGVNIEGYGGPNDALLAAAITDATNDGMNIINLSLSAGHRRQPLTQDAINNAWEHGIITVAAAGNDGPSTSTVGTPANNSQVISVGSVDSGWAVQSSVTSGPYTYLGYVGPGVTVLTPVTGKPTVIHANTPAAITNPLRLTTGCTPDDYKNADGTIAVITRGECTFADKTKAAKRGHVKALIIVNTDDEPFQPGADIGPRVPALILSLSDGRDLINDPAETVTLHPAALLEDGHTGRISDFSSRGPSTSGLNEQDVLAPGGNILSASAGEDCPTTSVCYAVESGTSMASPMVTGVVALVMSEHPDWTAAMVRSAVIHTARLQPGLPLTTQGAGLVDANAAIHAELGINDTAIDTHSAKATTITLINPTSTTETVTAVVPHGCTTPTPVLEVPAQGTALFTLTCPRLRERHTGLLTLTTQTGFTAHAVVSKTPDLTFGTRQPDPRRKPTIIRR